MSLLFLKKWSSSFPDSRRDSCSVQRRRCSNCWLLWWKRSYNLLPLPSLQHHSL
ncbi:Hypothetical predicted protein [Olea europaea subsp. europaea]|uniref:Uncharacterized protein n=1 Tax=Olea europaea subsp. europaea TaxID=158383 RepID=A0A8S0U9E2_OLEEU|nr:Hypothetical predicted protein [Olea europaea subsp. europaea]